MLEPTLSYFYKGQMPPLCDNRTSSVDPDHFFGLLSNAKYLILERPTEQCADVLGELIKDNHHQDLIATPALAPSCCRPLLCCTYLISWIPVVPRRMRCDSG